MYHLCQKLVLQKWRDLVNAYDDIDVSESMVYHMAVMLLGEVEDYVEIARYSIQF